MATSVKAATSNGAPLVISASAKTCAAPAYMISDRPNVSMFDSPCPVAATPKAKAMGKFILASSNRGNNEILSDFKHAYTYQENTVHALALALQHVQHKLLDFSEFTKPDKVYTFETTARQYLSLYNSLLNNSFESNYSNIPVNLQA
jgi:glycosyltransferase involved in cell wall biosynthesis